MATISEDFAMAVQFHQAGQLQLAEQIYRRILQADPNHPYTLCHLGMIASQVGKHEIAVELMSRAIQLKKDVPEFHNNLGTAILALRRIPEAVDCYRRAVTLNPSFADAHANLGNAFRDLGRLDEAAACYRQTLQLKPAYAETYRKLADLLSEQGKLDEAVACYRQVLELNPNDAKAHFALGNALVRQGQRNETATCYRRAIELQPDFAEAHSNLGVVLQELGMLDEAIIAYRRSVELRPDFAMALSNLGAALYKQGKIDEAVLCYRRALEQKPDHADALSNLGVALRDQGKLEEAIACCRKALEFKPDHVDAHCNLGVAYRDLGILDEAVAHCRRALEINPDYADAHNNLGNALKDQAKLDEAVECFRRALELKPEDASAYNNLGIALKDRGDLNEAIECYQRALKLKPDYATAHSNLLGTLQYREEVSLAELYAAHGDFDRRHTSNLREMTLPQNGVRPLATEDKSDTKHNREGVRPRFEAKPREIPTRIERVHEQGDRPRLGFVSADLGLHPVGYFLIRILENLHLEQVDLYCYSDRILKDELTHRFQSTVTQWRDVAGLNDEALARQIREDGIDVLFDLAGHTGKNRLLAFARKPAPIQITWAGYVGTTGMKAMDFILADRFEIPHGAEEFYHERVLRMPDGYVCYDPPEYAPSVSLLPALDRGFVTFGCFNNPVKITPRVIEVWSTILARLPGSRLVLKFNGLDDRRNCKRIVESFSRGIDRSRLVLQGPSPHAEFLAAYNQIDVALDPFPYSGGLTTCEALWMGVPVMTCPGETFASRHSMSHLYNVGLTQTIARDLDEYIQLAVDLANDLPRLAQLRAGLRERMAASPLCDGKQFAINLMNILRDVWNSENKN